MPLLAAASEVWSAMIDLPDWPTALREQGIALKGSLLRYGTIRMTLERMTPCERLELRTWLLDFTELAERLEVCLAATERGPLATTAPGTEPARWA